MEIPRERVEFLMRKDGSEAGSDSVKTQILKPIQRTQGFGHQCGCEKKEQSQTMEFFYYKNNFKVLEKEEVEELLEKMPARYQKRIERVRTFKAISENGISSLMSEIPKNFKDGLVILETIDGDDLFDEEIDEEDLAGTSSRIQRQNRVESMGYVLNMKKFLDVDTKYSRVTKIYAIFKPAENLFKETLIYDYGQSEPDTKETGLEDEEMIAIAID